MGEQIAQLMDKVDGALDNWEGWLATYPLYAGALHGVLDTPAATMEREMLGMSEEELETSLQRALIVLHYTIGPASLGRLLQESPVNALLAFMSIPSEVWDHIFNHPTYIGQSVLGNTLFELAYRHSPSSPLGYVKGLLGDLIDEPIRHTVETNLTEAFSRTTLHIH